MYVLHLNRIFPINHSGAEDIHNSQGINDVCDSCPQREVANFAFKRDRHALKKQQQDDGENEKAFYSCARPRYREGRGGTGGRIYGRQDWHFPLNVALFVAQVCGVSHDIQYGGGEGGCSGDEYLEWCKLPVWVDVVYHVDCSDQEQEEGGNREYFQPLESKGEQNNCQERSGKDEIFG